MKSKNKRTMALGIVAVLLASALFLPSFSEDTEDSDATQYLNVDMTFINNLGGFLFLVPNVTDSSTSDSGSNDAESTFDTIDTSFDTLTNILLTVEETIGFTSSYFQRMSEVAAAETWVNGTDIDNDTILVNSQTYEYYVKQLINYANTMSSICDYSLDSSQLSHTFELGSTSFSTASDDIVTYGMGTTVSSASADKVYIYSGSEDYSFIYVYGGSATIRDTDGNTYILSEGKNTIADIPSGVYELQTGRTYIGSLCASNDTETATVCPAAVLQGSSNTAYVLETSDGVCNVYTSSGTSTISTPVYLDITDSDSTAKVDLSMGFDILRGIQGSLNDVVSDSLSSASAAWMIFNTAGEASVFVSPSALIPNLANMDFTDDQVYLIYMSALQQMSEYYQTASGNFDAEDVLVSEDSLDLICYGTIYSDSTKTTILAEDVYFTPMCYERDQGIVIGSTAWSQPGLAMIWTKNTDGTYTASGLITLSSGNYLQIASMLYRGTSYTTLGDGITLQVKSLTEIYGFDVNPYQDTTTSDNNWTWLILLILGGACLILSLVIKPLAPVLRVLGVILLICGGVLWISTASGWFDGFSILTIAETNAGGS